MSRPALGAFASASVAALIHPVSLAAIATLVINDHFLKYVAPSWLTGKLSDLAGLFFTPYVCLAVLLTLLSFTRRRSSGLRIAMATYFVIGVLFTTLKTSTAATDFFVSVLSALIGQRISLVVDPSDLIALVALPASYMLLARATRRAPIGSARGRPVLRALALGIATVAMAATSGPPRPTVTSISVDRVDGDVLYAVVEETQNKDGLYGSRDGGVHWTRLTMTTGQVVADPVQRGAAYILDAPASDSGLLWLRGFGESPVEIGPGRRLSGTYGTSSTFLAIGQWPSPVLYFVFRGVLWTSGDGGVIWQNTGLGGPVYAVAPTPTPGLVYAATDGYFMRSVDGGRVWTHVIVLPGTGNVSAFVVHQDDPQLLFAGIGKELRRSTDGGLTWSPRVQYSGNTRVEFAHWAIFLDPHDPDRAYALFGGGCCPLMITTDRGLTWKEWGDAWAELAFTADGRYPLLALTPSRGSLLRHLGTPPGTWQSVGKELPLDR